MTRPVPGSTKSLGINLLARLAFVCTARQRVSRSVKWKRFAISAAQRGQFPAGISESSARGIAIGTGGVGRLWKPSDARGRDYFKPETAWKLDRAAEMVRSMSSSVCAAETNHASNCEGGSRMPRASISRKNAANRAVSDFLAPA